MAKLLADRGDLDGLRTRADAGDRHAAMQLARLYGDPDGVLAWTTGVLARATILLAERGDLDKARARADELRTRADAGDSFASLRLAELLADRGDLDELRTRVGAGDEAAAGQLAGLLKRRAGAKKRKGCAGSA